MGPVLVHLLLQAFLLLDTLAWEVKMPRYIRGLQGSCLVIPCSFYYTSNPPKDPHRIVWYQWVSRGYPLVYDPWYPNDVIGKFKGKTSLYGNPWSWDCSLRIHSLEQSHHGEKLYAWIDPENVGWRTYEFYDVTSTIIVDASPEPASIIIYGGDKTGDSITIACSTFHSCPYIKPSIILSGTKGNDQIKHEHVKDGLWKITLTRTSVIKAESLTIECSVTHPGGKTVTVKKDKSAQCVHHKITIEPELGDVTEGVAKNFTCSVFHSCQKETPTITWNYKNMQVSTGKKTLSGLNQVTYSNITFLGSKEDHGKKLVCTGTFSGGNIDASVVLHVHEHPKPVSPIQNETHFRYVADVIPKITALPRSCVVIEPGTRVNVKCSVNHTCSSHPPKITWSVPTARETISHNHMGGGVWETVSAVTFIPTGNEEKDEIVCSANFWGGKTQNNTAFLSIKRGQEMKLETFGLYAIAPSLVFILMCVLAGVCIYKRRHRQPHRDVQGLQTQLEHRRSVWTRFSSRFNMPDGRAAWSNRGKRTEIRHQSPSTNPNLRAEYKANNTCSVSGNKPFSKPHIPSPKSESKSYRGCDYDSACANLYGNLR